MNIILKNSIKKMLDNSEYLGYYPEYPLRNKYTPIQSNIDINIPDNNIPSELYIHIPFCEQKCSYCKLNSIPCTDRNLINYYVDSLLKEIEISSYKINRPINFCNLYFGGGTPTILDYRHLSQIISALKEKLQFNGNISIETTPNSIKHDIISNLKKIGLTRVSIGIQSFIVEELELMNRRKINLDNLIQAITFIKHLGISVNLDFIYGLPFQSKDYISHNTDIINLLQPETVFFYPLRIKKTTAFYNIYSVRNNQVYSTYYQIVKAMREIGYSQHSFMEFQNRTKQKTFADNYKYVLGLGVFATTYLENIHLMNSSGTKKISLEINTYIENLTKKNNYPPKIGIKLDKKTRMLKFIILGLRNNLLDTKSFHKMFNTEITEVFENELNILMKYNLISKTRCSYHLTKLGMQYIDNITQIMINNSNL